MDGVTVRRAVPADAGAVLDVHVRARSDYYRGFLPDDQLAAQNRRDVAVYERMIHSPDRAVRCAEVDGRVVGLLVLGPPYYPDPDPTVVAELYQIAVDPPFIGRGVGAVLHSAALATWRELGTGVARLWVWEFNQRARRFYHRHGWHPDGHCRPDDPRLGEHRMVGYRLVVDH